MMALSNFKTIVVVGGIVLVSTIFIIRRPLYPNIPMCLQPVNPNQQINSQVELRGGYQDHLNSETANQLHYEPIPVANSALSGVNNVKNSAKPYELDANNLIRTFNIIAGSEHNKTQPFACVNLMQLVAKGKVCIYDPKIDIWVSSAIQKSGAWEDYNIKVVLKFLKQYNDMEFLDLGANLGIYSIIVAQLGRRVVAVDANVQNLRLVSRSLVLSELQNNKITLLWNAISDKVETVQLKSSTKNIGGTMVVEADLNADEEQIAQAVTLDHLASLFAGKQLFIKMDIETNEWKALKNGTHFFDQVDVKYMLMEWMHHRDKVEGDYIKKFFTDRSYKPHHPTQSLQLLAPENSKTWPNDVLWIKDGASNTA